MKQILLCATIAVAMLAPAGAAAQSSGFSLGKMLEGVFSQSDLEVKDLAGVWTIDGSAVNFQSDNLLQKAGGAAVASAVENKIDPYFNQLGLKGAVMTVKTDGTFELKMSRATIDGTFTKNTDGTFATRLSKGKLPLGTLTTYIQKTSRTMDVTFDASKLQSVLSAINSVINNSTLSLANSILSSYDGICVGISMKKTGNAADPAETPERETAQPDSSKTTDSGVGSLIDILKSRLNR